MTATPPLPAAATDTEEAALLAQYQALVKQVPTRAPIYLPTDKIPLADKVRGMAHVKRIYDTDLEAEYRPRMRALRDQFKGRERCFLIGNGPSLNQTDLACLKDEVTFAVNGFFLKAEDLDWTPTFYCVEDHLVAEDRAQWINPFKGPVKFFPAYLGYMFPKAPDTIFYNHRPRVSYPHGFDFSLDAAQITYTGCTVTFSMMQLAAYLGFREIYLIGVDASYDIPADAQEGKDYATGVLDMKSDDPNHFDPDYFGKGFRWHDPQVHKMLEAYAEARRVLEEQTEQRIYNATVGGQLEVFERRSFASLFPQARSPEAMAQVSEAIAARKAAAKAATEAAAEAELAAEVAGAAPAPASVTDPVTAPTAAPAPAPAVEIPHLLGTYSVPTPYRSAETADPGLDHPRLLVLDMTAMGNGTATGEVKSNLLRDWPAARLLQVSSPRPDALALVRRAADGTYAEAPDSLDAIRAAIAAFNPQAILYRPLADRPGLHDLAMAVIRARPDTPLITWIMDDWPARLEATDPTAFGPLDADLRWLLARSGLCLSISDAMSDAFSARYGQTFTAFANGIDATLWSAPRVHGPGPVVLRYAGGLAPDMNAASLQRVARAVEARARAGQDIRFEINTRPHWVKVSGALFDGLTATRIETENRPPEGYVRWLCEADALLIAYNFDAASLRYVRYSMANKLPECLASGAALLAHGPRDVATIARLEAAGVADLVLTEDSTALEAALARLADPAHRTARGTAARALALAEFELGGLNRRLAHAIASAEVPPRTAPKTALPATAVNGASHAKSLNGGANGALNGHHPETAPQGPARFYLRASAGGALAPASLSDVAASLQQGTLQPGDLVLAYADPCGLVAQAMAAGQDPDAALTLWIRSLRQHLVVARTAGDLCRFHPLGQPHPDLPAEAHHPDPLALAVAALAVLQSPDALRFLAELTTTEGDETGSQTAALAAGASAQAALARLAALREATTAPPAATTSQADRLRDRDMQAAATLAQEQIRQLRATLGVYHADAEALRAELEQIKRSRSWRITEPLRGVRRSVSREVN
jgi:hypothetical protein